MGYTWIISHLLSGMHIKFFQLETCTYDISTVAEPFALLVQSSFFFVQTQFSLAISPYCLLKGLNFQVTSPIFLICTITFSQSKVKMRAGC